MSISSALNSASSGLIANSRMLETISNNVSNALTPGYSRRTVELSSSALGEAGSGVRVVGTVGASNPYMTAERRAADATLSESAVTADAYVRIMESIGSPGDAGALATLATRLETALLSVGSNPQSKSELTSAVAAAGSLADGINAAAAANDKLRTDADKEITRQVDTLNKALNGVRDLNEKIASAKLRGVPTVGLEDERSLLIDSMSSIVPITTVKRDDGHVAIYSKNGGVMLNGRVYEFGFDEANGGVTADMVVGVSLGNLMQDRGAPVGEVAIPAGTGGGLFDGGSLGALFEVRDQIAPEMNNELDVFAKDLVERFRDLMPAAALDGSGDGLFVDAAPGATLGLAGRLELNASVDPAQGGEVWRLRDGLGAVVEGSPGFGDYLQAMNDAMTQTRVQAGSVSQSGSNTFAGLASEIGSYFGAESSRREDNQAYLIGMHDTLTANEVNSTGVNTDIELETLMIVEQAYSANAQVLSALDQLMQVILEI